MLRCLLLLFPPVLSWDKYGKQISLSESQGTFRNWMELNRHHTTENSRMHETDVGYRHLRSLTLENNETEIGMHYTEFWKFLEERRQFNERLDAGEFVNDQRRLVEDLLDNSFYEKNVHPRRDYTKPTRINVSMSLYQVLDVDEHMQSITVNVWMVQNWYDEFLDWDPSQYGMINKTIVPYSQIWIPDTFLYNSETLEQKKTESLMNAIVETGFWANDSLGARVQLMFPAIYKLSCGMNVRWFPYDSQNCTFIISSWTRDRSTIDYWATRPTVNLANMAPNDEWTIISFEFNRIEQFYKCCEDPWVMLYAHLVMRRKPLYYIINLVIPTSIITIVAVTGFFTPTSSSNERDEKLYLGINTLLTMSIMMLMVCNQMPSTSTYVPLMSWYYIGVISVIVIGTLMATIVLAIHKEKHRNEPLPCWVRRCVHNTVTNSIILDVPSSLLELWFEFGVIDNDRKSSVDPGLTYGVEVPDFPPPPKTFFGSLKTKDPNTYGHTKKLANLTRQYTKRVQYRERERRHTLFLAASKSRSVKQQKMSRRCALEWEFLANVIDRVLLTLFMSITFFLFTVLVGFDTIVGQPPIIPPDQ